MAGLTHLLHGCVPSWHPSVQTERNYVPEEALKRHLDERRVPYRSIAGAADGDVLTIDDSTCGAARACRLARAAGHEVTLFVNPAQIDRRRTYWFSRFDVIMDQRRAGSAVFDGREFELRPGRALRAFRLAVKARLMPLPEEATDDLLDEVAGLLRPASEAVPEHARTMTVDDLRDLVARDVRIGSHGWDHRDIAAMTEAELVADLRGAQEWFHDRLGSRPEHYAVPYGLAPLTGRAAREVPGRILLAHAGLADGFLGDRQWNRRDLTTPLQAGHG
ncbi:polysaccharide deacetylase family protein [Actinoplanes sp. NPDC049599]|uniref:polysaccharide deacetylase family protein n=1 Tax=Actinoplanes sp. NPDC049599 TaxID=3363903 RepID=UPI0037B43EB7